MNDEEILFQPANWLEVVCLSWLAVVCLFAPYAIEQALIWLMS